MEFLSSALALSRTVRLRKVGAVARRVPSGESLGASPEPSTATPDTTQTCQPLTVLVVVPTLMSGAADAAALELVRILTNAGHRAIAVSRGGHLASAIQEAGGEFVRIDVASKNPLVMLLSIAALVRLIRDRGAHVVHAHGRTAAWSGYAASRITGVPFLTTWHKGFRQQNPFKRFYNGVMTRGVRIIAVSDQLAELINERHGTPLDRIAVVPISIDVDAYDPDQVSQERIDAVRTSWDVPRDTKVVLIAGRMLRRKGHHVVVKAVRRLKSMGVKDFACVFMSETGDEDRQTRYAAELWDLVLDTDTADVIRFVPPPADLPAVYAAATVLVSSALQHEGLQRAILEAQAMARPVVVSDLGAGREVVLAPPLVPEERMTGLRTPAGDDAALAAALIRLFSLPDSVRRAIGSRGRAWVCAQFNAATVAEQTLELYAEVVRRNYHGQVR